jgi:hypothetical protein
MMGSMSVKELYDDAGTLVGKAANLKTGDNEWTYYCTESPATGRCSGDVETTYPVYGQGIDTACGFCHGEALFAPIPGR